MKKHLILFLMIGIALFSQTQDAAAAKEKMGKATLTLDVTKCADCMARASMAAYNVDGVLEIKNDTSGKKLTVTFFPDQTDLEEIRSIIEREDIKVLDAKAS